MVALERRSGERCRGGGRYIFNGNVLEVWCLAAEGRRGKVYEGGKQEEESESARKQPTSELKILHQRSASCQCTVRWFNMCLFLFPLERRYGLSDSPADIWLF